MLRTLFLYFDLLTCSEVYNFLTKLMYLCLHKLISKYGKRIVLIFYIYLCIKVEESQSHQIFAFILSPFSFVRNATNFFIHSLSRLISKKKKTAFMLLVFFSLGPFLFLVYANMPFKYL